MILILAKLNKFYPIGEYTYFNKEFFNPLTFWLQPMQYFTDTDQNVDRFWQSIVLFKLPLHSQSSVDSWCLGAISPTNTVIHLYDISVINLDTFYKDDCKLFTFFVKCGSFDFLVWYLINLCSYVFIYLWYFYLIQ